MQSTSPPARQIHDTQSWVDRLYQAVGRRLKRLSYEHPNGQSPIAIIVISVICGSAVYAIGLVLAVTSGFAGVYVSTKAVYYGVFGIAWVSGWLRWGLLRFSRAIEDIRVCFTDEQQFAAAAKKAIGRMSSGTGALIFSLIMFSIALIVVILGLFVFIHDAGRSRLLPPGWYQDSRMMHLAILLVFAAACSFPLGTGLYLQAANALFLREIFRLTVLPLPGVLVARLRHLTAYYLIMAGSWFVGVALLALVFVGHLGPFSVFILSMTSAFGLVTALAPQFVFHTFITDAASEVAGEFAQIFKREFSSKIDHSSLAGITSMLQASQPIQVWVINLKDLVLLASGQLLPLAAVALRNRLGFPL
jgi:hypothetical protein